MKKNICFFLILLGACQSPKNKEQKVEGKTLCSAVASATGIDALPMPTLRENIGNSYLKVSTKNAEAQKWFNQGLNHLHGFWHLEAYRAFKQVVRLDTTCAMGYWGLAMCQPGFGGMDNRWENFINKALSLKNNTSAFEQDLILSCQKLITSGPDAVLQDFRNLVQKYPNEPEALAFAGIMMRQTNNDMNAEVGNEIKSMLETALRKFPTHTALMHYYIHLLELRPDFRKASPFAKKMIAFASASPHLSHMPGHLFYLGGDYEQAAQAYEKALAQEIVYHNAEKIPFTANQNHIHNLQFLAVTYAELGQVEKALSMAKKLSMLHISMEMPNEGAAQMLLYEGRILPALVHIRFRQWQEAQAELNFWLNTPDATIGNNLVRLYLQAMYAYCISMQATEQGNLDFAIQQGAELSRILQNFEQEGMKYQNTPDFKSINETHDIISMARYELAGWIDNINPAQAFNDAAWKEAIKLQNAIRYDEPPRLMYPIEESLGRLYLKRGNKIKANEAFLAALKKRPKSKTILKMMD